MCKLLFMARVARPPPVSPCLAHSRTSPGVKKIQQSPWFLYSIVKQVSTRGRYINGRECFQE